MEDNITRTIEYYLVKRKGILDLVNSNKKLSSEQIIENGKALEILEYKITALEIAKEN